MRKKLLSLGILFIFFGFRRTGYTMVFIELVLLQYISQFTGFYPLNYRFFFIKYIDLTIWKTVGNSFGLERKQHIGYNICILTGHVGILICNFLVNPEDEFKIDGDKIMRFF